ASSAKIVRRARTAEVQLNKLRAVGIPLKDYGFSPVVPQWCSKDQIFIYENVEVGVGFRPGAAQVVAIDGGEQPGGAVAVNFAIFVGEMNVGDIVVGFMHHQSARIRVVANDGRAARRREKRLGELRAGGPVINESGKDSGLRAANNACGIGGVWAGPRREGVG